MGGSKSESFHHNALARATSRDGFSRRISSTLAPPCCRREMRMRSRWTVFRYSAALLNALKQCLDGESVLVVSVSICLGWLMTETQKPIRKWRQDLYPRSADTADPSGRANTQLMHVLAARIDLYTCALSRQGITMGVASLAEQTGPSREISGLGAPCLSCRSTT